jgi:RNA polymerase sigma-70 factor (ECF subfamily)
MVTKTPDSEASGGALTEPDRAPSPPALEADPTVDSQRAFLTLLYTKYRAPLFRYVNGIIPSREEAEELVQETYLRVMRRSQVTSFEFSARNYLFETATNLARDHIRRRRYRRHDSWNATGDELPDTAQWEPDRQLAWDQAIAALRSGVADMSPLTREIFIMGRLREMKYAEIARALNIGVRTVERKMSEALALLAERVVGTL